MPATCQGLQLAHLRRRRPSGRLRQGVAVSVVPLTEPGDGLGIGFIGLCPAKLAPAEGAYLGGVDLAEARS